MIQKNKPLVPPYAIEMQYRRELQSLIASMAKDFSTLIGIYRGKESQIAMDAEWLTTDVQNRLERLGKKWQERFNKYAENSTPDRIKKMLKQTDLQLMESLKNYFATEQLTLIGTVIPIKLRQIMKINIAENVSLIKSLPERYNRRIQTIITNIINGNAPWKQLQKEISHAKGISMREAKTIARDQTNKVFNALTLQRFQQCGIQKVQWFHSHAPKEPRPYHIRMWDGKSGLKDGRPNGLNHFVFEIGNPPVIQEAKGKQPEIRGYPGDLINCGCGMVPITEFESI